MSWTVAIAFALVLFGTGVAASYTTRHRVAKQRADGLLISWDQAQTHVALGFRLYCVNFGYGDELWVCKDEPRFDHNRRILLHGLRVLPVTKAQQSQAQRIRYRT
jgi:hypothetical protein